MPESAGQMQAEQAPKHHSGRWPRGVSGNPAGKNRHAQSGDNARAGIVRCANAQARALGDQHGNQGRRRGFAHLHGSHRASSATSHGAVFNPDTEQRQRCKRGNGGCSGRSSRRHIDAGWHGYAATREAAMAAFAKCFSRLRGER